MSIFLKLNGNYFALDTIQNGGIFSVAAADDKRFFFHRKIALIVHYSLQIYIRKMDKLPEKPP